MNFKDYLNQYLNESALKVKNRGSYEKEFYNSKGFLTGLNYVMTEKLGINIAPVSIVTSEITSTVNEFVITFVDGTKLEIHSYVSDNYDSKSEMSATINGKSVKLGEDAIQDPHPGNIGDLISALLVAFSKKNKIILIN